MLSPIKILSSENVSKSLKGRFRYLWFYFALLVSTSFELSLIRILCPYKGPIQHLGPLLKQVGLGCNKGSTCLHYAKEHPCKWRGHNGHSV